MKDSHFASGERLESRRFRIGIFLAVACSLLLIGSPALADVTYELLPWHPMDFDGAISIEGNASVVGNFKLGKVTGTIPYQTIPIPWQSVPSVSSTPMQLAIAALDVPLIGSPLVSNLNLDLFAGQTTHFASNVVEFNGSPAPLFPGGAGITGKLTGLTFAQTGPGALTNAHTFSVDGELQATFTELDVGMDFFILPSPLSNQVVTLPYTLSGFWNADQNGFLHLYKTTSAAIPLSLFSSVADENGSAALAVSSTIGMDFNYEFTFIVGILPEPGSIALLVIGLAALAPLARRARTRHRRR